MNPITFPGLGLTFHIQRVAFSFAGKDIYWYGVIIAVGFLLGVSFSYRQAPRLGVDQDDLLDMLIIAAPVGIICARIYYVVFYLDLYTTADGSFDWREAIAIWDGGIAIYGGIIGAVLTCLIFCRVRKCSFPSMADACSYGLLIGQSLGRWGNFVNQEAYGSACSAPWRMGLTLTTGEYIEVHPTFLYESLWNAVGLALLYFVIRRHRRFDGMLFAFYLFWYGLGRVWIEGLRTDSLYLFNTGIRVSQLVAFLCVLGAGGVLVYQLLIRPRRAAKRDDAAATE
ncbi:MAG: prolipoprotein diacylglyceryl transferase [Clostridiales bacterium]|nr:prolipoprotein diacylglyceryl transferase [Clostridiales bacterium]